MAMHKEKGSAAPQFVSNIASVHRFRFRDDDDDDVRASVNLRATRELVGLLLRDWLTLITR